jgi:hypothetical protein
MPLGPLPGGIAVGGAALPEPVPGALGPGGTELARTSKAAAAGAMPFNEPPSQRRNDSDQKPGHWHLP